MFPTKCTRARYPLLTSPSLKNKEKEGRTEGRKEGRGREANKSSSIWEGLFIHLLAYLPSAQGPRFGCKPCLSQSPAKGRRPSDWLIPTMICPWSWGGEVSPQNQLGGQSDEQGQGSSRMKDERTLQRKGDH